MSKPCNFIDLFCGLGGFRLAIESFGGRCVFSCDIDEVARDAYETNYGEYPKGDITKIAAEEIPKHDILCAGYPCQGFSIAGKKLGFKDSTRGTLFFDVVRVASYHKPSVLFLENVPNLMAHDKGKTFKITEDILQDLGYSVYYKVLNAGDYGCPTSRRRIYLVCFREDLGVKFSFPPPTGEKTCLRECLLSDRETNQYVSNREFEFREISSEEDMFGMKVFPQETVRIGNLVGMTGQGCRVYSDLGHAITMTRAGGGVGRSTGLYLINGRVRRLAPRECARMMGFPDTFKLPDNDGACYRLLGNSVAVRVLKEIYKEVVKSLSEKECLLRRGHEKS